MTIYSLPYVNSKLDKLRDLRYLSTLDRNLTAFTIPTRQIFQFKRIPFGLTNALAVWQRLIDQVIGVDVEQYFFVYFDDVIIRTPTFEKHIEV